MRLKRIVLPAIVALVAVGSWAGVGVEDPDLDLGSSGPSSDTASGTNLTGTATGIFEDFTVDTDPAVCRNPGPGFGLACSGDAECDSSLGAGDGDCGPPRSADNGAESLLVVLRLRSGNDTAVFGDVLQCPFATGEVCAGICGDGSPVPPDRIDRVRVVEAALCLESRLGDRIADAFGKPAGTAVLKKFSRPEEDVPFPLDRIFWASSVELSLK